MATNSGLRLWFRLAAALGALILLGALLVGVGQFFPITLHSSATAVVGLSPAQQSELIATFCTTAARAANSAAGRLTLAGVIADSSLNYAARHRTEVDLRVARSMMHAALAAEPQEPTIAKMCETAGHRIASLNPEIHRPVSAATAAAESAEH